MLPNGPQWISAAWPSRVCSRLGRTASFSSTAIAPAACNCSAVTGAPALSKPTTMRPRRARRSASEVASARIVITSDAAVMSKRDCRGTPSRRPPRPITTLRRARSFMSRTRPHVIECGSMSSAFPCCRWLSTMAASRLWAAVTAWKSPVRCRFIASIGTTCASPAPAAPPLMPNTGPNEGCRSTAVAFSPARPSPSTRPIVVVVFPSPSGVGDTAVTTTYRPRGRSRPTASSSTLDAWRPKGSRSSGLNPSSSPISGIGRSVAAWAISRSEGTPHSYTVGVTGRSNRRKIPSNTASGRRRLRRRPDRAAGLASSVGQRAERQVPRGEFSLAAVGRGEHPQAAVGHGDGVLPVGGA